MKKELSLALVYLFCFSIFGFSQKSEWNVFIKTNYPIMDIQDEEDLQYILINPQMPEYILGNTEVFDITRTTNSKFGFKLGFQNQLQLSPRFKMLTGLTFKFIKFESINYHPETEWERRDIFFLPTSTLIGSTEVLLDNSGKELLRDDLYSNSRSSERLQKIFYADIPLGLQFSIIPNQWSIHSSVFYSRLFHANFAGAESDVYKDRILFKKDLVGFEVGMSFQCGKRMAFLIDFSKIPSNIYSEKNPFSANEIPHPEGKGLTEISAGLMYQF